MFVYGSLWQKAVEIVRSIIDKKSPTTGTLVYATG